MNEGNIAMPAKSAGWIESTAAKFNFDTFLKKFNLTTAALIEMAAYFGAGFLAGLFVKRYLKQLLIAVVVFFLIVKGLEYTGIGSMIFNWGRVKEVTGISPSDTVGTLSNGCFTWVQTHVRQVISTLIGFLIGMRV